MLSVLRNAPNIEGTVDPKGLCVVSFEVVVITVGVVDVDIEPLVGVVDGGVVVV